MLAAEVYKAPSIPILRLRHRHFKCRFQEGLFQVHSVLQTGTLEDRRQIIFEVEVEVEVEERSADFDARAAER